MVRSYGVALGALGVILGLFLAVKSEGSTLAQKPTPHPVEGRENCLLCHDQGKILPSPPDHQGRPSGTCLLCHKLATPAPSPTATATPAPSPTATDTPAPSPAAAPVTTTPTATPLPRPNDLCMTCHADPGLTKTFPSGEVISLAISIDAFRQSVHGPTLTCQNCHQGYERIPHPKVTATDLRGYTTAYYQSCERCHFTNYTKTLDSVHYQVLSTGNNQAPVCSDCHGAHTISPPDKPRSNIPRTCSKCHGAIYADYSKSVHGAALQDSPDVPTCISCHGVHNIQDPRTAVFRVSVPEDVCGKCHGDKKLMEKYGLSTNVLRSYLHDFHGLTVSLARRENLQVRSFEAVCSDCHGIHNIASVKSPESLVIKANLVSTCGKCHEGATENFPSAWLSHYEPSPSQAPLVFLVKRFYYVFIPLVIGGLGIQVLLNLWRWIITRGRYNDHDKPQAT